MFFPKMGLPAALFPMHGRLSGLAHPSRGVAGRRNGFVLPKALQSPRCRGRKTAGGFSRTRHRKGKNRISQKRPRQPPARAGAPFGGPHHTEPGEKPPYRKGVRASWWRGRFPLRAAATIHSGGKPSAGFPAAPGRSNHTRSPEDLLTGGWINWSDSILF